MQLLLKSPEELIKENWLDNYREDRDILWNQIVNINSKIHILDKIINFPFDTFAIIDKTFWEVIKQCLYESILLDLSKIILDKDRRIITIQKFIRNTKENVRTKKYKNQIDETLLKINFEGKVEKVKEQIKILRDKKIAHYDKVWNADITVPKLNEIALSIKELKDIVNTTNEVFSFLCFSEQHSAFLMEYSPIIPHADGTDIEKLLDLIARESDLLNMPEKQKEKWPLYHQNLTTHDIKIINTYRKKFKKPEI